jgi:hypothetical protein
MDEATASDTYSQLAHMWVKSQPICVRKVIPLLCFNLDASNCIDDDTGHFPSLIIHTHRTVAIIRGIKYWNYTVLIPVSNIRDGETDIYGDGPAQWNDDDVCHWGYGLCEDKEGRWYDNEELNQAIREDDNGERYRQHMGGFLGWQFIGLKRYEVTITNTKDIYIAHYILVNYTEIE